MILSSWHTYSCSAHKWLRRKSQYPVHQEPAISPRLHPAHPDPFDTMPCWAAKASNGIFRRLQIAAHLLTVQLDGR